MVFGFAVADGLEPVAGTAPYDVLGRQIARQLVHMLNHGVDRGIRFLPFLGNFSGKRSFLPMREQVPVSTLASLHKREGVQLLVDGALQEGVVKMRLHDGESQRLIKELELPFSATEPFAQLPRLWFEVTSALGWTDRLQQNEQPVGMTLAWLLVARDELLALEAGIERDASVDILCAARQCVDDAPELRVVYEMTLESVTHLVRKSHRLGEAAELLRTLGASALAEPEVLQRVAGLLQACQDDAGAAVVWSRVAKASPDPEAVETAAALWFRQGELENAKDVLVYARERGTLASSGLAQLAAVADRLRDFDLRGEIIEELLQIDSLPLAAVRLVASFLLEAERPAEVRELVEKGLADHGDDAGLLLDLGRACLTLGDSQAAELALRRARPLADEEGEVARDIARLLRLTKVPDLFVAMRTVDAALASGDVRQAIRTCREVLRSSPESADTWLFLGVVRHKLQQERRAEEALRKALELDDCLAEAHNRLGILLVGRGDLSQGYAHLRTAESLAPSDPSPQLHLAQVCALMDRRWEGERHLGRAEQLGAKAEMVNAIRQKFFSRSA